MLANGSGPIWRRAKSGHWAAFFCLFALARGSLTEAGVST